MINRGVKGLSSIVATLLIILLVLIVVGIVWVVVSRMIQTGSDEVELGKVTLGLEIRKATIINDSFVQVHVKRTAGEGKLTGLSFIFFDGYESEVIKRYLTLKELQETYYVLELEVVNANQLETISVAPIIELKSGKEATGDIKDEIKAGNLGFPCSESCADLGNECGTVILCGRRVSCGSCPAGQHCPTGTCVADNHVWEGDLISWWNFSHDASDTRGNNPGIVYGATLHPNGKSGGEPCYYFDGIDDYIDLGTFSVSGNEITIAAWVRALAVGDTWGTDPTILAKSHGPNQGESVFLMALNESDINTDRADLWFEITSGSSNEFMNVGNYNYGEGWHFLVYVYDGNQMRVYFDNSLVSTTPKTGNLEINEDSVNIGRNPSGTGYWEGYIDEPMIWGRAISEAEINEIYNFFL